MNEMRWRRRRRKKRSRGLEVNLSSFRDLNTLLPRLDPLPLFWHERIVHILLSSRYQ